MATRDVSVIAALLRFFATLWAGSVGRRDGVIGTTSSSPHIARGVGLVAQRGFVAWGRFVASLIVGILVPGCQGTLLARGSDPAAPSFPDGSVFLADGGVLLPDGAVVPSDTGTVGADGGAVSTEGGTPGSDAFAGSDGGFVGGNCDREDTPICAEMVVSRGTDPAAIEVAPLAVFFEGAPSRGGGTTHREATVDPWHDLIYRWHFGDDEAARWRTTGKPKNIATGPNAVHVFERPGTYTVTLEVTDARTGERAVDSVEIHVDDPDVIFAGERTICVSGAGNFDGCPAGARQVTTTNHRQVIDDFAADQTRILFRRAEEFTVPSYDGGPEIESRTGIIGTFGDGPRPIMRAGYSGLYFLNASDWRVIGLELVGQPSEGVGVGSISTTPLHDILVMDTVTRYFSVGGDIHEFNSGPTDVHTDIFYVDSDFIEETIVGLFFSADRMGVLGCIVDSPQREHGIRTNYATGAVLSHNRISNVPSGRQSLSFRCPENGFLSPDIPIVGRTARDFVISDNIIDVQNGEDPATIGVAPSGSLEGHSCAIENGIVARNHIIYGSQTVFGIEVMNARRVTVENNILDMTRGESFARVGIIVGSRHADVPAPTDIRIYNNTCVATSAGPPGETRCVYVTEWPGGSPYTGIEVKNQLLFAPAAENPYVFFDSTGSPVELAANQIVSGASPFVGVGPAADSFRLLSAMCGERVPVLTDFGQNVREMTGPATIGAWHLGGCR